MKKVLTLLGLSLLLLALVSPQNPNKDIKEFYANGLKKMLNNVQNLEGAIEKDSGVNTAYFELRNAFKQIEFLLAQVDKEFYLRHYNGAPLPKLEKNVPDLRVIEPKGMQVIDELVVAEVLDKEAITRQLQMLKKHLNKSLSLSSSILFTDELVIHAIHYQWIRDYTQGLVGFDTPSSLRAIEDAQASIEGILKVSKIFGNELIPFTKSAEQSLRKLKDAHFETLDRAEYYRDYWQPAFKKLVAIYDEGKIKTWSHISPLPKEVNPLATHLFSDGFFNTQAFIDFNELNLNPKTIALGERLFYEKKLSSNGTLSCGSCHKPEKAFTDGQVKSISANGESTVDRNAPTLLNSIYTKGFFYDLRSTELSQQFEHVVFSKDEFNTSIISIFEKLKADESYIQDFQDAFKNHQENPVNNYTFKTALASYVASLRGYDSEWDKYMRGEGSATSEAIAGFTLFMGKAACATCHFAPTFSGLVPPYYDESETEVLGVPEDKEYSRIDTDEGRYSIKRPKERIDFYRHSFKTTTTRDITNTAPYMHNGVFENLDEVVDFYNNGGGEGHGLEVPYQTLAPDSLHLTDVEQKQLIEFLHCLD